MAILTPEHVVGTYQNWRNKNISTFLVEKRRVSVAQSDAHLTSDQKIAGSIPAWSGNILS